MLCRLCSIFLSKCPGCSKNSLLKGKFCLYKCSAIYKAPTAQYWLEIIGGHVSIKWMAWRVMAILWSEPTVYKMHCRKCWVISLWETSYRYQLESQCCIKSSCQVPGKLFCAKHELIPHGLCIKWRPESHCIDAKDIHFIESYTPVFFDTGIYVYKQPIRHKSWSSNLRGEIKLGVFQQRKNVYFLRRP